MKFRLLMVPLILLLATLTYWKEALAETFDWKFSGWYGGGCYTNVEFDPNTEGRVYLSSDVAGIWRSDDNGDRWNFSTEGLTNLIVAQIAIAPKHSNVVYLATKGGLFYSTDAGRRWLKSNNLGGRITFERPASYRSVSVHPELPDSLCVGTAKGEVFCSENFGMDWNDLAIAKTARSKNPITALQYLPDKSGLLAATKVGVFRYNFLSASWVVTGPTIRDVTDLIAVEGNYLAAAGGELWRFDTTKSEWEQALGDHPGQIFRLAFDKKAARLYAAWNERWNGGVIASRDIGESWQGNSGKMRPDIIRNPTRIWARPDSAITSLKISPFDSKVLMRTDWWGAWRSDNQGSTWEEKVFGAPNTVGSDLAFSPSGVLFSATMDNGLLRSSDWGATYKSVFPSSGYDPGINGHVWRVRVLETGRVIATFSPWAKKTNGVALSDDGGETFRVVLDGLPNRRPNVNTVWGEGYPRALAVDPRDKNLVYLGIDGDDGGGLFISRDGGEKWSRSEGMPGSLRIYNGLAVDQIKPEIIYWGATGSEGGVYRSTDRGKTWRHVFREDKWIFDIHVAKDGTVYAGGAQGGASLFASRDQGETWSRVHTFSNAGALHSITTDPLDPNTIAASTVGWSGAGQKAIFLSRDAGATWIDVTGNLPSGSGAAAMAFSRRNGRYLYMSRSAGGIYRLRL